MDLNVFSVSNAAPAGTVSVADSVFDATFNEDLVHQVVVAYMAGGRAGTKAQKTRAEVQASTAKPWRQKGLGRARAGSRASPIWRGGGATFAARPRSYEQKVNRRMYRTAIRSLLSELRRQERLVVVDDMTVVGPKTKLFAEKIRPFAASSLLIVCHEVEENLYLASRNLPWVAVCDDAALDPVSLVHFDKILMTKDALTAIQERLS
ncbi:MAG: 50S ribosomal protein L4 [Gammaproteobacteria bacterium]|nr:50S ribosomal protein L4 [Gammaproteobacteria bacterium]